MNIFESITLGLTQGLTEFIPVSSSGHLEIVQGIINQSRAADFHLFLEFINFGTLLALLIFYRKKILEILKQIFKEHDFRLTINIILTSIPAGLIGLLLSNFIEENGFFSSLYTISIAMATVGLLMIFIDKLPTRKKIKKEEEIDPSRALTIGLAQTFALIPGVSRSGSTIIAGRLSGLDSKLAASYSFLASIPLMLAVCAKSVLSSTSRAYIANNWQMLTLSNLVAFASGLFALSFVLKFLQKDKNLKYFGYYRVILGLSVLAFALMAF